MPKPTICSYICDDLHYCCPFFFFTHFRNTQVIADRLGVTPRAVRVYKSRVDNKIDVCERRESCLHAVYTLSGDKRKIPLKLPPPPADAADNQAASNLHVTQPTAEPPAA